MTARGPTETASIRSTRTPDGLCSSVEYSNVVPSLLKRETKLPLTGNRLKERSVVGYVPATSCPTTITSPDGSITTDSANCPVCDPVTSDDHTSDPPPVIGNRKRIMKPT